MLESISTGQRALTGAPTRPTKLGSLKSMTDYTPSYLSIRKLWKKLLHSMKRESKANSEGLFMVFLSESRIISMWKEWTLQPALML